MPANKSHHYVPKFYLRNFTTAAKSKTITLYNIRQRRVVQNAAIKGQCCSDYFYGKDPTAEQGLAGLEGMIASLFRRMLHESRMPRPMTAGHMLLCIQIVLQSMRTKYAAEALNEMTDGMMREVFRGHPDVTHEQLAQVSFGYDNPAMLTTGMAMQFFPLVMDLGIGALLCPPGYEFMTSDNPVVMQNQLLAWRKFGSNTGMGSKGLQILFPVFPWLTVVLYDTDVYHFGETKGSATALATPQDVFELNVMQAVSASENIYMGGTDGDVFRVAEKAEGFRRKRKVATSSYEQPSKPGARSAIIATSSEDIRTDAALSFMKLPKHSKRWIGEMKAERFQPAVFPRNSDLMDKFEKHHKAVEAGKARHEDPSRRIGHYQPAWIELF